MKKLVFALQLLALMALFPSYVIIELKHVEIKPTESNTPPVINKKTVEYSIQTSNERKDESFILEAGLGCLLVN